MSTSSAKASAAGLVLQRSEGSGATQWVFAPPGAPPGAPLEGVRAVRTRCGLGLVTSRPFAAGEVLLKDRWLVGVPMLAAASSLACEQCLRVCAWSPTDSGCRGCRARYCSIGCRDAAWRQHHRLLCPAVAPPSQPPGGATPLGVFAKHARLAPSVLQQKAEEVLLAARVLARCTLWDEAETDADAEAEAEICASTDSGAAAEGDTPLWSRGVVPPPFHRLSSVCVIAAARGSSATGSAGEGTGEGTGGGTGRSGGGTGASGGGTGATGAAGVAAAEETAAARAAWLRDSYRLLLATPNPNPNLTLALTLALALTLTLTPTPTPTLTLTRSAPCDTAGPPPALHLALPTAGLQSHA